MNERDLILAHLFQKVRDFPEPEDHPTSSRQLALDTQLSLEQVLSLCQELAEEGFLSLSPLSSPPLVYLTITGVARARRLR
ncbi:hypothetical protein [Rufibacter psychrotolerans]|uniref:hypothetical protein n=1 Tax=Rufibacter psychrotolerans TaxID=2812556 RepID=UPI0019689355|nr:hypothetical protein [Rufibacter sp. SYSU D00308]